MDLAALAARLSGRSSWQVRLADGRVVSERQTDWDHLPGGRLAVRLATPRGPGTPWLVGYRPDAVFQLKVGMVGAGRGRATLAHLVGALDGPDGACTCWAYDYRTGRTLGPFRDDVGNLRFEQLGRLNLAAVGVV